MSSWKMFRSWKSDSQGRRLLWRLADEELMLQPESRRIQRWWVCAGRQPCESSAEGLPIISKLLCSKVTDGGWPASLSSSSLPSVHSEPLGWGKSKFVAPWRRPADQWQGGGRSWGREWGRDWEEGFYVTEWKIPRRDRHMPLLFLSSCAPSLLHPPPPSPTLSHPSISCSLSLFCCYRFKHSLIWVTFRVKRCQPLLHERITFTVFFLFFMTVFIYVYNEWHWCSSTFSVLLFLQRNQFFNIIIKFGHNVPLAVDYK